MQKLFTQGLECRLSSLCIVGDRCTVLAQPGTHATSMAPEDGLSAVITRDISGTDNGGDFAPWKGRNSDCATIDE
jgi:hypothetical protein